MSIGALISENIEVILAGGGATVAYFSHHVVAKFRQGPKAIEPVLIEGRTHDEWYNLIFNMGKETFERLALGPLDGLERSQEHGWDYKRLLGDRWKMLERQWYPERYPTPPITTGSIGTTKIVVTPNNEVIFNRQVVHAPYIKAKLAHEKKDAFEFEYNKMNADLEWIEEYKNYLERHYTPVAPVNPRLLTTSQIKYLQRKMGLRPDGIIGPHTRYELNRLMRMDPGLVKSLKDYRV